MSDVILDGTQAYNFLMRFIERLEQGLIPTVAKTKGEVYLCEYMGDKPSDKVSYVLDARESVLRLRATNIFGQTQVSENDLSRKALRKALEILEAINEYGHPNNEEYFLKTIL